MMRMAHLYLKSAAIEWQKEGIGAVKPVSSRPELQLILSLQLLCLHICILQHPHQAALQLSHAQKELTIT